MQSCTLSFCKILSVKNRNHILVLFSSCAANPPRITTHPEAINTIPSKHVTLTIEATGTEPLNYQWECKIGDGNDVERILGANSSTHAIPSVQKSNEGSYCCTVSNCAGSETSQYATLTVGMNHCEKAIQLLYTLPVHVNSLTCWTLTLHYIVCSARTQLQ